MENHLDNFDWDSFNISYTDDLKADTVNVTNLSSQIERNNKLLNYIQEQEDRFLNSQNYVKKLEEGFSQTQESCRIAHERSEDLHNKLKLSSELCDQLTSQVREIRHEGQNLNLSLESERTINTTLRTRNSFLENNQNTLTLHIQHLQNELLRVQDDNKKTNMEVLQSESSMHQTMEELALTNRINSDLINDNNIKQNYIIELKDKNLQLIQHYERIISNYNSVSDAMNISQHQIDNSRQKERVEQQSISDMEMYISELEENLAICNSKLHQLEQQRLEDVEKCNKTDLLWRQLEEVVRSRDEEIKDLTVAWMRGKEEKKMLEEKQTSMDRSNSETINNIKEFYESELEKLRYYCEDLKSVIERNSGMFKEELAKSEITIRDQADSISHLNNVMTQTRQLTKASMQEAARKNIEHEQKISTLTATISNLRMDLESMRTGNENMLKEVCQKYEEMLSEMNQRNVLYFNILCSYSEKVKSLAADSKSLHAQLQFMSQLQQKLLVLLSSMGKSNSNSKTARQSNEENSLDDFLDHFATIPLLAPLVDYGKEISKVFHSFEQQKKKLQKEYEHVFAESVNLRQEVVEQSNTILHLEEELKSIKEKESFYVIELEQFKQRLDEVKDQHRNNMQREEEDKHRVLARLENTEKRLGDLTKQTASLQVELNAKTQEHSAHSNMLDNKLHQVSKELNITLSERDELLQSQKGYQSKVNSLQDELLKAEVRVVKSQNDFQKLKKISLSLRDDMLKMKSAHEQQTEALKRSVQQYELQVEQKQKLLETLQEQRNHLYQSNQKLKEDIDIADKRSASINHQNILSPPSYKVSLPRFSYANTTFDESHLYGEVSVEPLTARDGVPSSGLSKLIYQSKYNVHPMSSPTSGLRHHVPKEKETSQTALNMYNKGLQHLASTMSQAPYSQTTRYSGENVVKHVDKDMSVGDASTFRNVDHEINNTHSNDAIHSYGSNIGTLDMENLPHLPHSPQDSHYE